MESYQASSLFSVKGKTALVTGASGFLGGYMVEGLLENGASVIVFGRSERINTRARNWQETYGKDKVASYQIDMYDLDALRKLLHQVNEEHPVVDILVNNAQELGFGTGFNCTEGLLENATEEQWMKSLTGIYWASLTTKIIGKGMIERKKGNIINISSMYAQVAPSPVLYEGVDYLNPPGYVCAKAGMLGLTKYTASFWGEHGIRCNALLPGPFPNVEFDTENAVDTQRAEFLKLLDIRTCLRRTGRAEELIGPLLFLASEASSFVTGHFLTVDGGWTVI